MISLLDGAAKSARPTKPSHRVLVLRLTILGCQPPIWRRLLVRESMWLSGLHDAIQVAFDWFDYQTHLFAIGDVRYGNPGAADGQPVQDDRDLSLADIGAAGQESFLYVYQFGEGWRVEVAVEGVQPGEKGVRYPVCTGGERAGPPEDCGGVEAFQDMLACLQEPSTDLGVEWREWIGPDYDPNKFDDAAINRSLRKLRK